MNSYPSMSFTQYLSAKKSVDDRALNRHVWQTLKGALESHKRDTPLRILEIGGGIGTMIERLLEWKLWDSDSHITLIDAMPENINEARRRLLQWCTDHAYQILRSAAEGFRIQSRDGINVDVELKVAEFDEFAQTLNGITRWDLVIANAFLDLVDITSTLPAIFALLEGHGMFYFTINFDGMTIFQPTIDRELDREIERLYHQTMDQRTIHGRPSGDCMAGRHLLGYLREVGAFILDAGSSDWVVFAGRDGYPGDESHFLHFIIHTMYLALKEHPELDRAKFDSWTEERHRQIESEELIYIAHQLDILGHID